MPRRELSRKIFRACAQDRSRKTRSGPSKPRGHHEGRSAFSPDSAISVGRGGIEVDGNAFG
jgi:hypothetical protein